MKAYKAGLAIEPENAGLLKGIDDLKGQLRRGEAPDLPKADAPKADPQKPAASSAAAAATAAAAAAPKQPKPKAAAAPSNLPIGQQWIAAAKAGDRATMEELLQRSGGEELVTYKARGIGHTAMHWAAATGDRQMMTWLMSLGGEVNARNSSDATPLHTAAGACQFMSVEFLLSHGADGSLKNEDGEPPAALALKKNRKDIADVINQGPREPPPPTEAEEQDNHLPKGMEQVLEREEVD